MKKIFTIFILAFLNVTFITAQNTQIWGTTSGGGEYEYGTIFMTDGFGENQTVVHSFKIDYPGAFPFFTKLCEGDDGKLYGMTMQGGIYEDGVIFEYDTETDSYSVKVNLEDSLGRRPLGSLLQASNGKLYGMVQMGGANNLGVLFEYDPISDIYTKILDFDGDNGGAPYGALIQAGNGKLYGLTSIGGANNVGVLFEYDPSTNIYTKKIDFDGTNYGSNPYGTLLLADNGKLYGMTNAGGTNGDGVLFEYDPVTDTYTKKIDFDATSTGSGPYASLVQLSDGKLYGMTPNGGTNGYGVIFEYDISSNTLTKKFDFDNSNSGASPYGDLQPTPDGKLYGMTSSGGANGSGVLFEYDPSTDTYTKKLDFDNSVALGGFPYGSPILASNGKLYGLTTMGGKTQYGVLFEYDMETDTYTKKLDFNYSENGYLPSSSVALADNNKLYGTTEKGGEYGYGVLFEYDPASGTYTKKMDFDGTNTGAFPRSTLIKASNGKLYGMTFQGGSNNKGVLFEYNPAGNTYNKILDFSSTTGYWPYGYILAADNGKLYGMTSRGGQYSKGVLFEYDLSTLVYSIKVNFDGINTGAYPYGSLLQNGNGKLYGVTKQGGLHDDGVLFEYDLTTDTYTKKFDFEESTGSYPIGALTLARNGKFYGLTNSGGANGYGVIFKFDTTTNTYSKIFDFDGTNSGADANSTFLLATNGKLYATTTNGGANDNGVLFELNTTSDTYTKKFDFDGDNGANPYYVVLLETNLCLFTTSTIDTTVCNSYTAPSGTIYTTSGTYEDIIPNSCGADSIITINLTVNNIDNSVTPHGDTLIANQDGATYQWIDCSDYTPIAGATNQTFIPTVSGSYAVIVTYNDCVDTSTCYTVNIAGVNPMFASVQIYPNPSNGIVNIDLGNLQNVSIKVYDATGKVILSEENINEKIHKLNLNQPVGFYVVEVTNENQIQRYKLMIK